MKREYLKPTATVVNIATESQVLAGSSRLYNFSLKGTITPNGNNIEDEFEFYENDESNS